MSVLINMEMPTSCDVCDFMQTNDDLMSTDYRFMYCGFPGMGQYVTDYTHCRLSNCHLKAIPEHGRLIDADNIGLTNFEIILCQKGNQFKNALEMLLKKIENAPTIIEAEEDET